MIYFMQEVGGGPVKIGHTGDLAIRHKQLEEHYGRPLAVLATMKGGRKREAEIHARFADIRLDGPKRCGVRPEQFKPSAELMAFIGRPLLVGANPDAVETMEPLGRHAAVVIKGSPEWKAWVEEGAKYCRLSVSTLADLALAAYLKAQQFKKEPPER